MNEELQSTNEELETMNDELRQRTVELNDVNAFLETILASLGVGVVGARPRAARCSSGTASAGAVGGARRRGGGPALPRARHRPARRAASSSRFGRC